MTARADESRYWGERQTSDPPDHRLRRRAASPQQLWEDPEVEAIARGRFVDRLLDRCGPEPARVLELACGVGWLALELARRGHDVLGMDISEQRIVQARLYAERIAPREPRPLRLRYEVADLNTALLPAETFDRIVCWDGLHHIAEIERLLMQAHRSLRPGGRLLAFDHVGPRSPLQGWIDRGAAVLVTAACRPGSLPRLFRAEASGSEHAESEGAAGREIVSLVREIFGAPNVGTEEALGFGKRWLARLRGPRSARLSFVRGAVAFDRLLLRCRITTGEYLYLEARKQQKRRKQT
ncbi:MAG: class I SAM-dependent methyltransferase [Candidatus Eisenbacteria bacterium]|nr:class I SAM-dependent methyltransferase [Candidatus Eisenbacteria bacterium]